MEKKFIKVKKDRILMKVGLRKTELIMAPLVGDFVKIFLP
jgi:hypothetical protein